MRLDVVTIFPDYFAPLGLSLVGKAISAGTVELTRVGDRVDHRAATGDLADRHRRGHVQNRIG